MKKIIALAAALFIVLAAAAVTFSAGASFATHNLPAEYVELEYIECDGRQIINTGIKCTPKTCYEVTFQVTNTTVGESDEDIAAGKGGSGSYKGIMGCNWSGGGGGTGSPGRFQISYGVSADNYSIALGGTANKDYKKDTEKHTLIMDAVSAKCVFDGVEVISLAEGTTLQDEKLGLIGIGGCNYTSSTTEWNDYQSLAAAKIYYVKITNDGTTVGEFIPACRVADQNVGMYDLVTNTFFDNVHETVLKDDSGKEVSRTLYRFMMPGQTEAETAYPPITQAPETQAPETPAPETQAPETQAPETQAPETQTPETQAPATQAPEAEPAKKGCGSSSAVLPAAALFVLASAVCGCVITRRKRG